jgi:diguanylate cyclase (GGDEF)-like protein
MSRAAFWLMLRRIAVFAGGVDLVLLAVFLMLGMTTTAWLNLISCAMYALAWRLLVRRRNLQAVLLMWAEVLVHAGLYTVLLGWDCGFHYYLLVFIAAVAVSRSPRHALLALAFLLMVYLGLDLLSRSVPVRYPLPEDTTSALRWLNIAVVFCMFGYTGRYYVDRVAEAEQRLRNMAATDAMTGLWNRREFRSLAKARIQRGVGPDAAVALVLADIDHFKQVNDCHGHDAGDQVIRHVAACMRHRIRAGDVLSRWGGEEFIMLLPGLTAEGAAERCDQLRQDLALLPCTMGDKQIPVTASFGVVSMQPGESLDDAVRRADAALYRAKNAGRNRVDVESVSPDPSSPSPARP